jgi:hypothetical protein
VNTSLNPARRGLDGDKTESLAKNVNLGFENYRDIGSLGSFPAGRHAGLRYNPFKAADEKIARSVVQVNLKPQYLVFCLHSRHLFSKQRGLAVESSKRPCRARTWRADFAPDLVQRWVSPGFVRSL